jgi:hypothetical protein
LKVYIQKIPGSFEVTFIIGNSFPSKQKPNSNDQQKHDNQYDFGFHY